MDGLYLIFTKRLFWIYLYNGIIVPAILCFTLSSYFKCIHPMVDTFLYLNFLVVFAQIYVCKNYPAVVMHCKSSELSCLTYENSFKLATI